MFLVRFSLAWLLACFALALVAATPRSAVAEEYVIQPEDVLSIQVSGEPGLSKNYPVDETGHIALDMVGRVKVAGLTAREAQKKLAAELSRFLKIFEVNVFVVGEMGARVLIYGEVKNPGSHKVRPGGKLLDVLAEAGQPTASADTKRITLQRRKTGKTEVIDLDAVLKDPALNLPVEPGDTITVPSKVSDSVRVDGEVRNPGFRPLEEARTAYAAIQAAGPTENADWKRVVLRRKGSSVPLIVDLSQVRTGQLKDDLQLESGDRITVLSRFSGTATLRGEVRSPGEKDLNGTTQLWDFIQSQGGGFTDRADRRRVQIIRRDRPVRTVDLVAVARGARRADDPELEVLPGDVVFVPLGVATILGEVKNPGSDKPIGASTSVWDFLVTAGGGFTDKADLRNVRIVRDGKVVRTVDLTEAARAQRPPTSEELELESGDTIVVPNDEANRFAIVGGVKEPGTYPVKPGMTLLDALAMAKGFSERATKKQFVVAPADRFGPDGRLKLPEGAAATKSGGDNPAAYGLVVIDYKRLLKGDPTQNVAIRPGDRILIPEEAPADPNRRKRSFLDTVLRLTPLAALFMGAYPYGGYY